MKRKLCGCATPIYKKNIFGKETIITGCSKHGFRKKVIYPDRKWWQVWRRK